MAYREVDGYSGKTATKGKIGFNKKGIGPTILTKCSELHYKVGDLYSPEALSEKLDVILPIKTNN